MRRMLIAAGAASVVLASGLNAQTTVFSTFGAGDSYNTSTGYTVATPDVAAQSAASSFLFGGPTGDLLYSIRFAAFDILSGPLDIGFLEGSDISTANLLESWSVLTGSSSASIYTLLSVLQPALTGGQSYWVRLSPGAGSGVWWAWNLNDQGASGFSFDDGSGWTSTDQSAPAFDVSTIPGQEVVPEPASMALMATGLLGLAMQRRRKRA